MHLHRALNMGATSRMRPPELGFTLVELMVALAIGLIVSLAVMMGYLGAAQSQRGQTDLSRMQETARFTFDLFGRETRNAAFRTNVGTATSTPTPAPLCFGPVSTCVKGANPYLYAWNDNTTLTLKDGSTATVINNGDAVTFRYYGADVASANGTADGTILNCTGTGIATQQTNEDTLYIARDTTNTVNDAAGEPTLFCSSRTLTGGVWSAAAVVPLIPGVESLQILYGEDTNADGIVDHYVPVAGLSSSDLTLVKSLMVSVVVRSPGASGFTANTQTVFNHFGTDYAPANAAPSGDAGSVFTAPADGRLRRVFNTIFAVRNAL